MAVTHPAGRGPHKVESLRTALTAHAVESALLLSEPQAAAVGYAAAERVEPGAVVAVYDFGGGTFDAAVVRKAAGGVLELLGTPQGLERLGGLDLDEAVFEHVRAAIGPAWEALDPADPAVFAAVAGLRRECTSAKEALSHDTEVLVPVRLPGAHTQVRLGRAEFEETIRPAVLETVDAMRRAIDSAVVAPPDLTALLLVGGSSRIPRVAQLVSTGIGRSVPVDVDPKGVIAAGAALTARGAAAADGAAARIGVARIGVAPTPVASRPPTRARPFAGAAPAATPRRTRVVAAVAAAGVLSLALLGGALAFAADRPGPGDEAEASVPATGTSRVAPGPPTGGRQVAPLSPGPPGVPGRVPATAAPPVPPSGTRASATTPSPPATTSASRPPPTSTDPAPTSPTPVPDPDGGADPTAADPTGEIGAGSGEGGSDEGAGTDPLAGADG